MLASVRIGAKASTKSLHWGALVAVLLIGLALLSTATLAWGPSKKFISGTDSSQYLHIAMSLVGGKGLDGPL